VVDKNQNYSYYVFQNSSEIKFYYLHMYCDINGKISSFLNNCLQESVGLESVIILITLLCSRKTWML